RQRIPLVVLDWRGRIVTAFEGNSGRADLRLREAQLRAISDGTGMQIAIDLIRCKLAGSIHTLRSVPSSMRTAEGFERLGMAIRELHEDPPRDVRSLMIV